MAKRWELLFLLFAFVLVCSLAKACGFSWKQAILLAVITTYLLRALLEASPKPRYTFEPYYAWIAPNWEQILADYMVVKNDEDWQKFLAWCESKNLPLAWYAVLRNDKDGVLIYRGSEEGFSTAINWNYKVTRSRDRFRPGEAEFPGIEFFVRQKVDLIELGLIVSGEGWRTFSSRSPGSSLETIEDPMLGQVHIVLAHLSLREFDLYWNEVDYHSKNVDRTWKSVTESRKKHGWEKVESGAEFPSSWAPIIIKHKYFKAQHQSIK